MKGITKDSRRLSEGDRMSLERESIRAIQNNAHFTCSGSDKPLSAKFGHLKEMKNKKCENRERNNSFEG